MAEQAWSYVSHDPELSSRAGVSRGIEDGGLQTRIGGADLELRLLRTEALYPSANMGRAVLFSRPQLGDEAHMFSFSPKASLLSQQQHTQRVRTSVQLPRLPCALAALLRFPLFPLFCNTLRIPEALLESPSLFPPSASSQLPFLVAQSTLTVPKGRSRNPTLKRCPSNT